MMFITVLFIGTKKIKNTYALGHIVGDIVMTTRGVR